ASLTTTRSQVRALSRPPANTAGTRVVLPHAGAAPSIKFRWGRSHSRGHRELRRQPHRRPEVRDTQGERRSIVESTDSVPGWGPGALPLTSWQGAAARM